MLIKLIQEKTEKSFLDDLAGWHQKGTGRAVLLCNFSSIALHSGPDATLPILKDIIHDYDAALYFCADGDIAVTWRGRITEIKAAVMSAFMNRYPTELAGQPIERLFQFFDTNVHGEDLRLLFRGKLNQQQSGGQVVKPSSPPARPEELIAVWKPQFSAAQQKSFRQAKAQRKFRKSPYLLVVEDQDFSRKLLMGLLEQKYRCYGAKDAEQAAQLYAEYAPDIIFLDIELPDVDGHTLAALFRGLDPDAHIVMVTGNNHVKDVEIAKANKVQGYIVKPYNKLKITGVVDAFIAYKKGR